jgi:signal recognition particle subunit SRP54
MHRFAAMKEMLKALGEGSTGFLSKIPGFKQLAQMRQLKDMNLDDIFGAFPGDGAPGQNPGAPGSLPGLPRGYTPPGSKPPSPSRKKPKSAKARNRRKAKRKQRRKSRRRSK